MIAQRLRQYGRGEAFSITGRGVGDSRCKFAQRRQSFDQFVKLAEILINFFVNTVFVGVDAQFFRCIGRIILLKLSEQFTRLGLSRFAVTVAISAVFMYCDTQFFCFVGMFFFKLPEQFPGFLPFASHSGIRRLKQSVGGFSHRRRHNNRLAVALFFDDFSKTRQSLRVLNGSAAKFTNDHDLYPV
jgi:hypothetical protein